MEVRQLSRSLAQTHLTSTAHCWRRIPHVHRSPLHSTQRRSVATRSRTRKLLKIAPHPSFLAPAQARDQIIFNPPSSEASVFHTPFKFLPPNDPRRRANLPKLFESSTTIEYRNASSTAAAASQSPSTPSLPPLMPKLAQMPGALPPKHIVSAADIAEIRKLRTEDPVKWSVWTVARKFNCSPKLVIQAVQSSREHRDRMQAIEARVQERWGPKKRKAMEERSRRWEMVMRGDL